MTPIIVCKRLTVASHARSWLSVCLLGLMLAACADPGAEQWSRAATEPARRDSDYRLCRQDTRQAFGGNIDQDVAASRQSNSPFPDAGNQPGSLPYRDAERGERAFDACMREQGYRRS